MLDIDLSLRLSSFRLQVKAELPVEGNIALLGESGSGKTSLLRVIAGLVRGEGNISFRGHQWLNSKENVFVPAMLRRSGFVFQDYALFTHMSVAENVAYGVVDSQSGKTIDNWLANLQISDLANRMPESLSGGQKQRVAIARALASNPQCLLMDEPFSALDYSLKQQLRRDLRSVLEQADIPMILATHDMSEAQYFCDQGLLLSAGRIIDAGAPADLLAQPKSLQVAKLTGWTNLFSLDEVNGDRYLSPWGQEYVIPSDADYTAFGIKPSCVTLQVLGKSQDNVSRVSRIISREGSSLVEIQMPGRQYISCLHREDPGLQVNQAVEILIHQADLIWMQ